jgi:hypothetical protein
MLALIGVRPYTISVTVLRANRRDFATSIQFADPRVEMTDCGPHALLFLGVQIRRVL